MTQPRHTPGPWELLAGDCRWIVSGGADGRTVASVETEDCGRRLRHADADAALIASAPALLAACEALLDTDGEPNEDIKRHAREVVRAARGES